MENRTVLSDILIKFVNWYRKKPQKHKDFASALMMSKLTDEELLHIKKLTDENAKQLIDIAEKSGGKKS